MNVRGASVWVARLLIQCLYVNLHSWKFFFQLAAFTRSLSFCLNRERLQLVLKLHQQQQRINNCGKQRNNIQVCVCNLHLLYLCTGDGIAVPVDANGQTGRAGLGNEVVVQQGHNLISYADAKSVIEWVTGAVLLVFDSNDCCCCCCESSLTGVCRSTIT